jgi:hypothetical protein
VELPKPYQTNIQQKTREIRGFNLFPDLGGGGDPRPCKSTLFSVTASSGCFDYKNIHRHREGQQKSVPRLA